MKSFLFFLLSGLATAILTTDCGQPSGQTGKDKWLIVPGKSFGPITTENCTPEAIKRLFRGQFKEDSIQIGEGYFIPGIILFPDQKNEVEIGYEPDMGDMPSFIRISRVGSDWHTIGDVRVGSTLEEVEKANGKGFSFLGFGWDYGGTVTEWYEGQLTGLMMTLVPIDSINPKYSGDKEFGTLDPLLPKKQIVVESIGNRFLP